MDLDELLNRGTPAAPDAAAPPRTSKGPNLDELLARSEAPAPEISRNESFLRGGLKGGTFGLAPAMAGAAVKASTYLPDFFLRKAVEKVGGVTPTDAMLDAFRQNTTYADARDMYRQQDVQAQQANPKTFLVGELAGSALAPAPGSSLASGATTVGGKVLARGVQGAATGGLFEAGNAISEGAGAGDVLKRAGQGAATGAVVAPVLGAVGDKVGETASKLLQQKADKRMFTQAIKDIAGSKETGLSKPTDRRFIANQIDSLRDEFRDPQAIKIADTARKDPGKAWEMVQKRVDDISADRAASYAAVDSETGGFRIKDLRRFLSDEVERLGKKPGQKIERDAVDAMIKDIDDTWGQQLAPTVPTLELRQYVTRLQRVAADTMGGLEETRRVQILDHVSGLAKDYLDKHLNDAAKLDPGLKPVVDGLRDQNKRVAAWLSLEDALKTRASKLETNNMVDNRAKSALSLAGMAELAHQLHSPYAAAAFAAGAAAPYVVPPLDRTLTRAAAGIRPGPIGLPLDIGNTARYLQATRSRLLPQQQPASERDYTQP
jgi:hypothetical protein